MQAIPSRGWVFALLSGAVLCLGELAAAPAGASWKSLFNGKDLAGWAVMNDVTAEIKEGNLRVVKGMGWLRSEQEYQDFILEFEWRALEEKYDSGIYVRSGLPGKPWPDDGWQINLRYDALGGLVKGFKPVVPSETPRVPLNQWVKFRIEVRGKKIRLDVNGERAWESDALDRDRGYLGIQVENKAFDFRDIRIQELAR
jgi:hypothetical protein